MMKNTFKLFIKICNIMKIIHRISNFQCQIPDTFINSRRSSTVDNLAGASQPSSSSTSSTKPDDRRKKRGGSLRKLHRMLPKLPTEKWVARMENFIFLVLHSCIARSFYWNEKDRKREKVIVGERERELPLLILSIITCHEIKKKSFYFKLIFHNLLPFFPLEMLKKKVIELDNIRMLLDCIVSFGDIIFLKLEPIGDNIS